VSKRKRKPFKDGIYKVTIDGGAPAEVVPTAVIEMFLDEIELSSEHLEALGFELREIQVEIRRIPLEDTAEAYGLAAEVEAE
jgi:hypothetical protein